MVFQYIFHYYFLEILLSDLELVFMEFKRFYKTSKTILFSFYLFILYSLFCSHFATLCTFCTFSITSVTKEKTTSFNLISNKLWPPIYLTSNTLWNLINIWIWKIYLPVKSCQRIIKNKLVCYFYKHVAFLRVFL